MDNTKNPLWLVIFKRVGILIGVLLLNIVILIVLFGLGYLAQESSNIHLRIEEIIVGVFWLTIASLASVIIAWTKFRKIAKRVIITSLIAFSTWIIAVVIFQTVETNKFIALTETVKPPTGMERIYEPNSNKLSPVPVVECIDFMSEGCPLITKSWKTVEGGKLDRKDLEKAINDSGWNVTIDANECNLDESQNNRCVATGKHQGYEANLSINEIGNRWEFRMKLAG